MQSAINGGLCFAITGFIEKSIAVAKNITLFVSKKMKPILCMQFDFTDFYKIEGIWEII